MFTGLVVTIIILLILAGVTLWLMGGSEGILGKATKATDLTNIATAKEQVSLKIKEYETEYYDKVYVKGSTDISQEVADWIFENYGNQKIQTTDYTFSIELPKTKASNEQNKYSVSIEKNNKLKTEILGTLYANGKLV